MSDSTISSGGKPIETTDQPFYKDVFGMIIAGVVLAFFFYLSRHMLGLIGEEPKEWARATYIFSGIEAIAFAAAGFIFGREVNRKRAEQAESRADSEAQEAKKAANDAIEAEANGRSLVTMIKMKQQKKPAVLPKAAKASAGLSISHSNDIDELLQMGEKLFPRSSS